ncbi:hypothetical protein CPB85DRAFT_1456016 [Mucidula mucida]|nr:hypothetical protein CPB85DRAFT_1456016 [Mucidula mucida]
MAGSSNDMFLPPSVLPHSHMAAHSEEHDDDNLYMDPELQQAAEEIHYVPSDDPMAMWSDWQIYIWPNYYNCLIAAYLQLYLHQIQYWTGQFFWKTMLTKLGLHVQLGHSPGETCSNPFAGDAKFTSHGTSNCFDVAISRNIGISRDMCHISMFGGIPDREFYVKAYWTLSRLTNNLGTNPPPNRYQQFLRMIRQWRHLKLTKRMGRGNEPSGRAGTTVNDLVVKSLIPLNKCWLYHLFLAIDANFQLKCLSASSRERNPALNNGNAYFVEDNRFTAFIKMYEKRVADETTVVNLKKGEKYLVMDYAICMALQLNAPPDVLLSYDIACQWHKKFGSRIALYPEWLQPPQPAQSITYLIPKFHLPAHIVPCCYLYSFNWTPEVGQTDGEALERGWAASNGAAASTKEMGPGSRLDTLNNHFGDQNWQKDTLGKIRENILGEGTRGTRSGNGYKSCDGPPSNDGHIKEGFQAYQRHWNALEKLAVPLADMVNIDDSDGSEGRRTLSWIWMANINLAGSAGLRMRYILSGANLALCTAIPGGGRQSKEAIWQRRAEGFVDGARAYALRQAANKEVIYRNAQAIFARAPGDYPAVIDTTGNPELDYLGHGHSTQGHVRLDIPLLIRDVLYEQLVEESALFQYGSPQYNAWFARKQKEHKALSKSCQKYEKWAMSKMESRATELDSFRRARFESIIASLKADGWDREVELPYTRKALQEHVLLKQPRKLTDRIWDTIRPALTEIMSTCYFGADPYPGGARNDFFATLPETPHHPPPSALCVHQPFFDIIKNTPPAEDATSKLKEAFDSATVIAISAAWREQQEKHLIAMLRRKKGRKADLSLIVNAFTCVECSKYAPRILHYPHFASHSCFYSTEAVGDTKVALWTGKGIKTLEKAVYARCQEFVRRCGLDPDTATAADMDGADVFFHCEECDGRRTLVNGMKLFKLMRWRTAMNHHHIGKVSRVDDAELLVLGHAQERTDLEEGLAAEPPEGSAHFVCVHCDVAETSKAARAEHLRSVHEIGGEPKAADHYRRTLKNTNTNKLLAEKDSVTALCTGSSQLEFGGDTSLVKAVRTNHSPLPKMTIHSHSNPEPSTSAPFLMGQCPLKRDEAMVFPKNTLRRTKLVAAYTSSPSSSVHLDESGAAARQDDCMGVTLTCCVCNEGGGTVAPVHLNESAAARQEDCVGVALAGVCLLHWRSVKLHLKQDSTPHQDSGGLGVACCWSVDASLLGGCLQTLGLSRAFTWTIRV